MTLTPTDKTAQYTPLSNEGPSPLLLMLLQDLQLLLRPLLLPPLLLSLLLLFRLLLCFCRQT